ncbi:MAG: ComF family protein [Oscillospiraceae bacterium]|nr:ComF family protein [Oscillospiraceae bacterium]
MKLLDLLFPPKCILCRCVLDRDETQLCVSCAGQLLQAEPIARTGEFFTGCVAACDYAGHVRAALQRYKFRGADYYAPFFGGLIAGAVREKLSDAYDLVTWTPISPQRRRARGYDQAELLAAAVCKNLGGSPVRLLRKVVHTPPQSGTVSAAARRANVLGVYEAENAAVLTGRRILLIDDIMTTGATLSECSRVLRTAGAASVCCAVVAATK